MMTNRQPWTKGYFEHIENRALTSTDRLAQHCFKDTRGRFFDELRNPLPVSAEPIGAWGLHTFRTIDDEISKALGIPLAAE